MQKYIEYYLTMDSNIDLHEIWMQWLKSVSTADRYKRGDLLKKPPQEIEVFTRTERFILKNMTSEDFGALNEFLNNSTKRNDINFETMLNEDWMVELALPKYLLEIYGIAKHFQIPRSLAAAQYLRKRVELFEEKREKLESK